MPAIFRGERERIYATDEKISNHPETPYLSGFVKMTNFSSEQNNLVHSVKN